MKPLPLLCLSFFVASASISPLSATKAEAARPSMRSIRAKAPDFKAERVQILKGQKATKYLTLRDAAMGVTMQYPADWKYQYAKPGILRYLAQPMVFFEPKGKDAVGTIGFGYVKKLKGAKIEHARKAANLFFDKYRNFWIGDSHAATDLRDYNPLEDRSINWKGKTALSRTYTHVGQSIHLKTKAVWIPANDGIYVAMYYAPEEEFEKGVKVFEEFLKTLKL